VNRKNLFAPLACALLSSACWVAESPTTSVHYAVNSNTVPTLGNGFVLYTNGPVQMYVWGTYSSGKQVLLYGNHPAFQIASTPDGSPGFGFGNPNATPPQTVQLSSDGLLTPSIPLPAPL